MISNQTSHVMNARFDQNYEKLEAFKRSPQTFFDQLTSNNPESAKLCFNADTLTVCCVDGRLHDGNVGIAGCGCLLDNPGEEISFIQSRAAALHKRQVLVSSHEGCGAAAIKQIDPRHFSEQLSRATGAPYAGHFSVSPFEFHDEVAVYYCGTETIGLQHFPGMPRGFRVSRAYYPTAEMALSDVQVCMQIAFGQHGFGNRFTDEKPFLLIAVGNGNVELSRERLEFELQPLASDRVKIVGIQYLPNE